jgi:hypothetical protein
VIREYKESCSTGKSTGRNHDEELREGSMICSSTSAVRQGRSRHGRTITSKARLRGWQLLRPVCAIALIDLTGDRYGMLCIAGRFRAEPRLNLFKGNVMAGKKFLNPILKIVLCSAGMAVLAYFLYPSIQDGTIRDGTTVLRGVVFLGFAYLLAQSIRELLGQPEK